METTNTIYDVAFSFLKEDEVIAFNVNDLIESRVKTFIYSKKQEELVGNDGEEKFHEIFAQKSKIVVIFYRQNWGSTPWTRIEMTAIKNRSLNEGYAFTIFVPLDKSDLPIWLPRTIIWFNFERWGVKGLASVIEAKLSEAGVEIKGNEDAIQLASRKKREIDRKLKVSSYLKSKEAYDDAMNEFIKICSKIEELSNHLVDLGLSSGKSIQKGREIRVRSNTNELIIIWVLASSNSLNDSKLKIKIIKYLPHWMEQEFKTLDSVDYDYHMNDIERKGWITKDKETFIDSTDLADYWIKQLIQRFDK